MITRIIALVAVLIVGAAAPARAWCEAGCLAEAAHGDAAGPHCPTHEPADTGTSVSATAIGDCPVIESVRPTVTARIDLQSPAAAVVAPPTSTRPFPALSFVRQHRASSVFERSTPLRI